MTSNTFAQDMANGYSRSALLQIARHANTSARVCNAASEYEASETFHNLEQAINKVLSLMTPTQD